MATIPKEWVNAATNMSVISGAIDVPVRSGRLTARSDLVTASAVVHDSDVFVADLRDARHGCWIAARIGLPRGFPTPYAQS
jgi:hypothetical protein